MRAALALCAALAVITAATPAFAGTYGPPEVILPAPDSDQRLADLEWRKDTHDAWAREWLFQGLNVVDAATTCAILARGGHEQNPVFGHDPSCGRVVGVKAGVGLLHYLLTRRLIANDPHTAKHGLVISITIQGAVDVWNLVQLARQ